MPVTGRRPPNNPSIIHQRGAEDVLADALDDEPLGLGRLRHAADLRAKSRERGVGKADAELVDAVECGVERGQAAEFEGREAGPGKGEDGTVTSSAATPG